MSMRFVLIILIAIIAFVAGAWYMGDFQSLPNEPADTSSQTSTMVYDNADENLIQVMSPASGSIVAPTFVVAGRARGNWYFEASFPLEVRNEDGIILLQEPVQAGGEWMTTDFVPFTTQVTVPNYTGPVTLILHKDNASGLPEHDASVSIPITIQ